MYKLIDQATSKERSSVEATPSIHITAMFDKQRETASLQEEWQTLSIYHNHHH